MLCIRKCKCIIVYLHCIVVKYSAVNNFYCLLNCVCDVCVVFVLFGGCICCCVYCVVCCVVLCCVVVCCRVALRCVSFCCGTLLLLCVCPFRFVSFRFVCCVVLLFIAVCFVLS